MKSSALNVLRKKGTTRGKVVYVIGLALIFAISSFVTVDLSSISEERPGGTSLEVAFWLTSVASAFLTFIITDVLFRSRESRLLSSFPVDPVRLFDFQMGRVFRATGVLSLGYIAFWLAHLWEEPRVFAMVMGIFPIGLGVCGIVSAAIAMYVGNKVSQTGGISGSQAMAFSTAPAIALAVSLMINLMLKLLAEALLKPNYADAALTAIGIVVGVTIAAWVYARYMFKRRYYAVYASFQDVDSIVVNGDYDFLDGKCAADMLKAPLVDALRMGWREQYRRRHGMANLLIVTFALSMGIYLSQVPATLTQLRLPCIAPVAILLFSKPWVSLFEPEISRGAFDAFALADSALARSRVKACLQIMALPSVVLGASVAIPYGLHMGFVSGAIMLAMSLGISAVTGVGLSLISEKIRNYSTMSKLNYGLAGAFLVFVVF